MKRTKIIGDILTYLFLCLVLIMTIFPIFYAVSSSLKSNMELMSDPGRFFSAMPSFENYVIAWKSPDFRVGVLLKNSLLYTLAYVTSTVSVAAMAGYTFARGVFPCKKLIFACFSSLLFIKLGGISIYATFQILNGLGLPRNLPTLMLINVFGVPVIHIYLVKGYVEGIPHEIDEAAKADGASFVQIFTRIIVPLLKPILATVAILAFQTSWNDYLMPTIFTLTSPSQRTLTVGLMALKNSGDGAASWNLILAGSVIAILPALVLYAFANRFFVSGLTAGAVKG